MSWGQKINVSTYSRVPDISFQHSINPIRTAPFSANDNTVCLRVTFLSFNNKPQRRYKTQKHNDSSLVPRNVVALRKALLATRMYAMKPGHNSQQANSGGWTHGGPEGGSRGNSSLMPLPVPLPWSTVSAPVQYARKVVSHFRLGSSSRIHTQKHTAGHGSRICAFTLERTQWLWTKTNKQDWREYKWNNSLWPWHGGAPRAL